MKNLKTVLSSLLLLSVGVVLGGYLFNQSQPRSFLAVNQCDRCLNANDLIGLLGSVGVQKLPGLIPSVIYETDKSLVVINPLIKDKTDYVIVPKKDIKNAGDIAQEDIPYLIDAYQVAGFLIKEKKISSYRIFTNGPEFQDVTYLHFHLLDERSGTDGNGLDHYNDAGQLTADNGLTEQLIPN